MNTLEKAESFDYLEMLNHLRNDYSDEIPTSTVNSTSPNPLFKVRKGWFLNILNILYIVGMDYDLQDSDLLRKFEIEFTSEDFKNRLTTKEDIYKGNEVLDYLISVVQGRQKAVA